MRHFDISEWSDYVRGLDCGDVDALEEHLASGCDACGAIVATLRAVADDASAEARMSPPDWAVRTVRAYYGLMRPELLGRRRLGVKLAFDSALEPASIGVRGGAPASDRQRVYYSQEYAIYLRLGGGGEADSTAINGELVHRTGGPLREVPAILLASDRIVESSLTGEFGDFRLGAAQAERMRLCLLVSDEEMLELPLDLPAH